MIRVFLHGSRISMMFSEDTCLAIISKENYDLLNAKKSNRPIFM